MFFNSILKSIHVWFWDYMSTTDVNPCLIFRLFVHGRSQSMSDIETICPRLKSIHIWFWDYLSTTEVNPCLILRLFVHDWRQSMSDFETICPRLKSIHVWFWDYLSTACISVLYTTITSCFVSYYYNFTFSFLYRIVMYIML